MIMELIPNEGLPRVVKCEPASVKVIPGKVYSWCACGLSAKQPLCDSTHKNVDCMPFRSLKVQFEEEEEVLFCQCKHTSTPPFCDDTHSSMKQFGTD